jgi:putative colanic acid biosynthesis UDP-glucose lipid carrier transferase
LKILSLIVKQFITYGIISFAFVGVFRSINIQAIDTLNYLVYSFAAISILKLLSYYILKSVRVYLKGNLRNIVVIGSGESVNELKRIFVKKKELGYRINAVFNKLGDGNSNGSIKDSFQYLEQHKNIDEINCSID